MTITSHIDIFAEILNSSFFTMKQSEIKKKYPYVERDISWMYFNQRILLEAARPEVPLLERLTFLGIYSNNLDEFFRVLHVCCQNYDVLCVLHILLFPCYGADGFLLGGA